MVSIWEALCFAEEFKGSCRVVFGSHLVTQRHVNYIEVTVLSILNPLREKGSLNSVSRPVPGILTLNNVKFSINSLGHNGMSRMRSSAVHDHWVKTIESQNSQIVT